MTKNKYIKLLIIIVCIIFVIMSVTSTIMAGNTLHANHCNVEHCHVCGLIQIATDFIKNIELISFDILILIAIVPLMQLIEKDVNHVRKLTLVELKVVQNK